MKRVNLRGRLLPQATVLLGALLLAGCNYSSQPDNQSSVYKALDQNNLRSVTVSQDRHAGTMTLRGIVAGPDQKARAETLVRQAAPEYTISNMIQVEPTGFTTAAQAETFKASEAIENRFKAGLDSSRRLKHQHIQFSAANGTLYLKGSVRTEAQKREAEDLAKKIPAVQQVVNDIQVIHEKSSRESS